MAAVAPIRPGLNHLPGTPQDERDQADEVAAAVTLFENGIGRDFRLRCEEFYRQYRGFKKFRNAWEAAGPNDRDGVVYDAKKHWGANLHIPLSFRTVETMVPRAIAQRPRMLVLPRDERWQDNVENVRLMIDSQQEQIDIELEFQDVMRSGMIYGLGAAKTFWRTEFATRRRVKPRLFRPGKFVVGQLEKYKVFDDPDFENIDIFDLGWDPFGNTVRTCGWMYHRVWLSLEGSLKRVQSGSWNTQGAQLLDEAVLRSMGSMQRYDEIWSERMAASGFGSFHMSTQGEQLHELIEWHDGERVQSLLDRRVLVQSGENPCVGMLPFHVYRPTRLPKQMVGVGEIEPIQHLQRELDTLRSQRRDSATIALCAGYAYDDAAIDEDDLVFGPAAAIRVTNARPGDAIMSLPVRDVPGSGYQEEQVIRSDIDAVTGISDQNDSATSTATEAQLVQAALSTRVEMKSRRFEVEIVRQAARCFLYLDQRMITENRPPMRQPGPGSQMADAAGEGRWQWFPIGPGELQGEYEIIPEGGSMAAENVPQMRQDAVQLLQLFGNSPFIDPERPVVKALQLFGIKDPESWLKQSAAAVPPQALEILQRAGVDPRLIELAVRAAQRQDPMLNPEGPSTQQVASMMGPDTGKQAA